MVNKHLINEWLSEAFLKKYDDCYNCVYFTTHNDSVPYGEGNVPLIQYTCECRDPYECQYVQVKIKDYLINE
jgi:hypothetical protein